MADEIADLRPKLNGPVEDCLSTIFREYCRIANDISDHHRGGPKALAKQLFDRIGNVTF